MLLLVITASSLITDKTEFPSSFKLLRVQNAVKPFPAGLFQNKLSTFLYRACLSAVEFVDAEQILEIKAVCHLAILFPSRFSLVRAL